MTNIRKACSLFTISRTHLLQHIMAKKISIDEFYYDCIDFMLKKFGIDHNYIKSLPKKPADGTEVPGVEYQDGWYQRYTFDSFDEYAEFKRYFYRHWKDYQPKTRWKKHIIDESFRWFNLLYGLRYNYDFDEHMKLDDELDVYKEIYSKK